MGCYSTGDGTAPPPNSFYFPVGLAVSTGGNVLYAVNSDFDLQWNGGTLQSYDLHLIRRDTVIAIHDPTDPQLPLVRPVPNPGPGILKAGCPNQPPTYVTDGTGARQPLGETCSPPVDSTVYVRDSAIVGAFATDLQLSPSGTRLYMPVRGDASLTWANVVVDAPVPAPLASATSATYAPFKIDCGVRVNNRCAADHQAGNNPFEPNNTRNVTMPGEPFGMAQSEDGASVVITHQSTTMVSLFSTGFAGSPGPDPALQFVLGGFPNGGVGVTAIPHDPLAFAPCTPTPQAPCSPLRPAFLETFRDAAELDLIRFYNDDGSTLVRPFLTREGNFTLSANAGGTDSRGIVIDRTPRIACEKAVSASDPNAAALLQACARRPARVFIANRTPATLIVGEVGEQAALDNPAYDPDKLVVYGNVPLSFGPSNLYLAPIVDANGNYALRVFIVCFDSSSVYVYDPDAGAVEAIIRTGPGPFALAFDPFNLDDVALHAHVPPDPREPGIEAGDGQTLDLKAYRFAYLASFTNSYVQVLDLDNSLPNKDSFESVVYTLGLPAPPKGQQ